MNVNASFDLTVVCLFVVRRLLGCSTENQKLWEDRVKGEESEDEGEDGG